MKLLLLPALLLMALVPVAPAGATSHCPLVTVTDDGVHSVTHNGGLDVVVNGAGVSVDCFGFVVAVYEVYATNMACQATRVTDDGVHGAHETGGTVYVNGAGVRHNCLALAVVPENFHLP